MKSEDDGGVFFFMSLSREYLVFGSVRSDGWALVSERSFGWMWDIGFDVGFGERIKE